LEERAKPDNQGIEVTLGNHDFDMHNFTSNFIGELPVVMKLEYSGTLMSTHASVLEDSVGPPSAEVCRIATSFP
jgi:hypothetical protein